MGRACGAYGEGRVVHGVVVGKHEGKRLLGDTDIDERIILRWIFRKYCCLRILRRGYPD